jgi:hypothetical protein
MSEKRLCSRTGSAIEWILKYLALPYLPVMWNGGRYRRLLLPGGSRLLQQSLFHTIVPLLLSPSDTRDLDLGCSNDAENLKYESIWGRLSDCIPKATLPACFPARLRLT